MSDETPEDDPRLFAAVQEYMSALEQGRRPNRRDFIARFPDIAGELSDCLDALAFVNSAAGEMPGVADPIGTRPTATRSGRDDIDAANAQPLGDFKLVRKIGHGGMGTVYEATQLSLGRRVAIKVLPMAAALDERHLERFHNEAQAAARLHHSNIVPVYAVGCERSIHFYAMQLIPGHSLSEVIRDLRKLVDRSAAGLSPDMEETLTSLRAARSGAFYRSVVKLIVQVAEALAYAHEAGVVHRDIKPANLLLDGQGKLWITDFGLAQLNVDTGLTRSGDLIGTLRYMSPEQASGRAVVLDQRTDIYSLGVTLYELLTLERALPGTSHEQLLSQIANHQPRSLRTIDKGIPRELEIIVNKAISKDAIDRYGSADALADDLKRFLNDESIRARPPSLIDKTIKWTRRHKALAASIFAIFAVAALGLSASTALIARAQRRTEVAYQNERLNAMEARLQGIRAERSGRLAREAVDFFARVASEEMDKPGYSDIRREMLEESLAYYQSFLDEVGDSARTNAEVASARSRVTDYLSRYTALDALLRAADRARLLDAPSVRDELGVTAAQVGTLLSLADRSPRMNFDSTADGSNAASTRPSAQAAVFLSQTKLLQDTAVKVLGGLGMTRLREIYLQKLGPAAMDDADMIRALQLTPAQRLAVRSQLYRLRITRPGPPDHHRPDEFMDGHAGNDRDSRPNHHADPTRDFGDVLLDDAGRPERPPGDGDGPGDRSWQAQAVRSQTLTSLLAILTSEQRSKWNVMLGATFDIRSLHMPNLEAGGDHMQQDHPPGHPPPDHDEPF